MDQDHPTSNSFKTFQDGCSMTCLSHRFLLCFFKVNSGQRETPKPGRYFSFDVSTCLCALTCGLLVGCHDLPCLKSTLFALNVGASKGTLTFMDYGWSCCWIYLCPPWSITNKESWNRIQMHQVLPTFAHSFRVQEQTSERLMKVYRVVGLLMMKNLD